MPYTEEERKILERHVTDLDGDVYAIFNLPQEVVAVIFAYVSRSARSFRANLLRLVLTGDIDVGSLVSLYDGTDLDFQAAQEKAMDFHERITIGYGHSSVAELAGLAIGIENISRLASAELELSNRWLSFIEYSQRYQKPKRGKYVTPAELTDLGDERLTAEYHQFQDYTFDVYEELMDGLMPWLKTRIPRRKRQTERGWISRLEKIAFEDARYALTLAAHTNLGMTGNARALRDGIVRLLSLPYEECNTLAARIRTEATKVVPTLIRYADPNPYQMGFWSGLAAKSAADLGLPGSAAPPDTERRVKLIDWTGRSDHDSGPDAAHLTAPIGYDTDAYLAPYTPGETTPDEKRGLARILSIVMREAGHVADEGKLMEASAEYLLSLYEKLLAGLGPHDHPHNALKHLEYVFEITVSEANWHQLLRHCRQIDFAAGPPAADGGVTIPPHIQEAGLADVLMGAVDRAGALFEKIAARSPRAAHYVITNAHNRTVIARVTLWEMFHLINLRGKPDTQWDIRQTVFAMREVIRRIHPHLLEIERVERKAAAVN